jgi:hypothetical protein
MKEGEGENLDDVGVDVLTELPVDHLVPDEVLANVLSGGEKRKEEEGRLGSRSCR